MDFQLIIGSCAVRAPHIEVSRPMRISLGGPQQAMPPPKVDDQHLGCQHSGQHGRQLSTGMGVPRHCGLGRLNLILGCWYQSFRYPGAQTKPMQVLFILPGPEVGIMSTLEPYRVLFQMHSGVRHSS